MDSNRFTEMGPRSLAGRPPEEGWRQALSGAVSVDAATTLAGRFVHDCNIFSTITTDDTSPMQYLLPHTHVAGYPMVLRPYRSGGFGWTQTIGLVQEESACAFFCWSTVVDDGDGSHSVDAESLTKR
jgi:hypothetical protein